MCYSFTPVQDPSGSISWLPRKVLDQMLKEGRIAPSDEVFPGGRTYIYRWIDGGIRPAEMRFDLVPRFFLKKENPSLEAMLKRKRPGKSGGEGFNSYNARAESLGGRPSFRGPWLESRRMAVPVSSFRERPNMEGAPPEFRGKEYLIRFAEPKNLAGIWDRWENASGEILESFAFITVDSAGNDLLRSIWHERCPLILEHGQVEEWLDPKTSPERAAALIRLHPAAGMRLEAIAPAPPNAPKAPSGRGPDDAVQTSLF